MSKLLMQEYPLMVLPNLARKIGLNEAIFLQQLHYWLTERPGYKPKIKQIEGDVSRPWIYNTVEEREGPQGVKTGWCSNFPFWSARTIKRIIRNLRKAKLIITTDELNNARSNRTLWYTIDYEAVSKLEAVTTCPPLESDNLSPPEGQSVPLMTETTTENENTLPPQNGGAIEVSSSTEKSPPKKRTKQKESKETCPAEWMDALYILCAVDKATASVAMRKRLSSRGLALIKAGQTIDDLRGFYSWWYAKDWRGKQGQAPTPEQVGDSWGKFKPTGERLITKPAVTRTPEQALADAIARVRV